MYFPFFILSLHRDIPMHDNIKKPLNTMRIPKEILAVERPKSTVVRYQFGKYNVIKRTCIRDGLRSIPVDLGRVGEIINGKFIALSNPVLKDPAEARENKKLQLKGEIASGTPGRKKGSGKVGIPENRHDPDCRSYGPVALRDNLSRDILEDLASVFTIDDSKTIYGMALLRSIYPHETNRDMKWDYENSYLSVMYPGLHLSESRLPDFLSCLGKSSTKIRKFMALRASRMSEGLVAIDGTLKCYESDGSTLSGYSYKAKLKGRKDISLLVALNVDKLEPICSRVYVGGAPDSGAIQNFVKEYGLSNAVIMQSALDVGEEYEDMSGLSLDEIKKKAVGLSLATMDKGVYSEKAAKSMKEAGLMYLAPLKRNDKRIELYGMDDPCEPLTGYSEGNILSGKCKMDDGRFLYSFRDPDIAHHEDVAYIASHKKDLEEVRVELKAKKEQLKKCISLRNEQIANNCPQKEIELINKKISSLQDKISSLEKMNVFDENKYREAKRKFGLVVYITEVDVAPILIYVGYSFRWQVEVYCNLYKNIIELGPVAVHDDYRVYGTEFINFISTIIGTRVKNHAIKCKLYDKMSQQQIDKAVSYIKKIRDDEGNWQFDYMYDYVKKCGEILGILPTTSPPKNA